MKDDDALTGAVPDPDAEATPAERAHARRFAELVDKTLAGRTPPAMPADDRALIEVATVIRAAHGHAELAADRQRSLVEDALRQAIGSPGPAASVPLVASARRWQRAPWIIAGSTTLVAAAAVAALWLRPAQRPHPVARAPLPAEWTSRSADSLIGPIARDRAADASARIDAIFADRLDGYRARRLARGGKP
jgi:hypothetical protein